MSGQTETYVTKQGDTVDLIAFGRFGAHGMEEAILDANPGLATAGPILPIGVTVLIPVPQVKDRTEAPRLWD